MMEDDDLLKTFSLMHLTFCTEEDSRNKIEDLRFETEAKKSMNLLKSAKVKVRDEEDHKQWYLSSLDCKPPSIDFILSLCIEKIWTKYDEDNSGYLDREEAKRFVVESIRGEEE